MGKVGREGGREGGREEGREREEGRKGGRGGGREGASEGEGKGGRDGGRIKIGLTSFRSNKEFHGAISISCSSKWCHYNLISRIKIHHLLHYKPSITDSIHDKGIW